MEIVFFTHRFLPLIGGVETSVYQVAKSLVEAGNRVTIITEGDNERIEQLGTNIIVVRFSISAHRPITRLFYWVWIWKHRELIKMADVLHFHDYGTFIHWYAPFWIVFRSPVYAMTFHGFDGWPIRWKHQFFRQIASSCMDVRYGVGLYIAKLYTPHIDYFFLGAPTIQYQLTSSNQYVFDYMFVGRLEPDTGIEKILTLLSHTNMRSKMSSHILLVGNGSLSVKILGYRSDFVSITILPPSYDLKRYYQNSRIIICTGFLAVFNVFALKIPAIIPAFSGYKQDYFSSIPNIEKYAWVCKNDFEFESSIRELSNLANPSVSLKTTAAFKYSQTQTWRKIAELHIEGYTNAMERKRA